MLDTNRLSIVAKQIRDRISLDSIDRYLSSTGISKEEFVPLEPRDFSGRIFAVDGSNVVVCSWSMANLNLIRAGFVVYQGRTWQRTVITYEDVFMADQIGYKKEFEPFIKEILGKGEISFKDSDLDRLSSYFRELQEYIAIIEAINDAEPGDIILYDGSFDVFEPLRAVLFAVFARAKTKGVGLLAVSKSSSLFWGDEASFPFVQHASIAGSMFVPGLPWYLSLKNKNVDHNQSSWEGETYIVRFSANNQLAFRVDVPAFLLGDVQSILSRLAAYSCSSECLGYPHALFRAHRDIRIIEQEKDALRQKLVERFFQMGMSQAQVRLTLQDYHDVLEMRSKI